MNELFHDAKIKMFFEVHDTGRPADLAVSGSLLGIFWDQCL